MVLGVDSHDITGPRRVHNKDSLLPGLLARLLRLPPTESLQVLIRWYVNQPLLTSSGHLLLFLALNLEVVDRSMGINEGAVVMRPQFDRICTFSLSS